MLFACYCYATWKHKHVLVIFLVAKRDLDVTLQKWKTSAWQAALTPCREILHFFVVKEPGREERGHRT